MITLGINGVEDIFHDASSTIIVNGKIIASAEEERFNRIKHSNGIPFNAIEYCLNTSGINFSDIDHIGYYLDPDALKESFYDNIIEKYNFDKNKIEFYLNTAKKIKSVKDLIFNRFSGTSKTKFHYINHHLAHASSSFFVSGLSNAAILTLDGSGDKETCTLFAGNGNEIIKIQELLAYPESLGFIYTIIANHLGLGWISGPGKLMGLAGFGSPCTKLFEDIVIFSEKPEKPISIDLSFFDYYLGGTGLTPKGLKRFGKPRDGNTPLLTHHYNLAASTQKMLEKAVIHIANTIKKIHPQQKNLCYAGGIALNISANRKLINSNIFENIFITPPSYDGGTSLGCALYLHNKFSNYTTNYFDVFLGPDINEDFSIENALNKFKDKITWEKLPEDNLCDTAAELIYNEKIIGWIQGRMECGPRALGNRSILANPTSLKTKTDLDCKIKKREPFRPYAASVIAEKSHEWFNITNSPYMLLEANVLPHKQKFVPAIVHVDGTCRPQTVSPTDNPRFYKLLQYFLKKSGVPILLNTSFNMHGEPIVNRPEEAIYDLISSGLDAIFIADYFVLKK